MAGREQRYRSGRMCYSGYRSHHRARGPGLFDLSLSLSLSVSLSLSLTHTQSKVEWDAAESSELVSPIHRENCSHCSRTLVSQIETCV
jgi:hypothetical protein